MDKNKIADNPEKEFETLKQQIKLLSKRGESITITITEKHSLRIDIVDYGDGMEYCVTLYVKNKKNQLVPYDTDIDHSPFGNINELMHTVQNFIDFVEQIDNE